MPAREEHIRNWPTPLIQLAGVHRKSMATRNRQHLFEHFLGTIFRDEAVILQPPAGKSTSAHEKKETKTSGSDAMRLSERSKSGKNNVSWTRRRRRASSCKRKKNTNASTLLCQSGREAKGCGWSPATGGSAVALAHPALSIVKSDALSSGKPPARNEHYVGGIACLKMPSEKNRAQATPDAAGNRK